MADDLPGVHEDVLLLQFQKLGVLIEPRGQAVPIRILKVCHEHLVPLFRKFRQYPILIAA
jgi:hypothetical protein